MKLPKYVSSTKVYYFPDTTESPIDIEPKMDKAPIGKGYKIYKMMLPNPEMGVPFIFAYSTLQDILEKGSNIIDIKVNNDLEYILIISDTPTKSSRTTESESLLALRIMK